MRHEADLQARRFVIQRDHIEFPESPVNIAVFAPINKGIGEKVLQPRLVDFSKASITFDLQCSLLLSSRSAVFILTIILAGVVRTKLR